MTTPDLAPGARRGEPGSTAGSGRLGAVPLTVSALAVHARLALVPWMLGMVLFGYGFVHWDQSLYLVAPGRLGLLLLAWASGHAGTMWLNAALDREEAAAVFARRTPVPRHLGRAGYAALAAAVLLATAVHPRAGGCVAACAALAIAYSHPALAWKGHPVAGPLVNLVGYGLLSPLAGAAVATEVVSARFAATLGLWSLWILGAYLAAQAFQRADDRRRGYRTFVVTHGPVATLRAARWCMNSAIVGAAGLTVAGYYPRLSLLAYPGFLLADAWMRRWQREPEGGSPRWAIGLFRRMLYVGLGGIALVWIEYWFG